MNQSELSGKNVLVVEDDYLQAQALAYALKGYGARVIGPFPVSDEGLRHCGRHLIDAAVLDINIADGTSFPLADRLIREGVPFIFLTGDERRAIPQRFQSVPHYLKPFIGEDVPNAVALALARRT
jgi:DNA-binding response OmpR family regulator